MKKFELAEWLGVLETLFDGLRRGYSARRAKVSRRLTNILLENAHVRVFAASQTGEKVSHAFASAAFSITIALPS